jgi:hypothetical protein
MNEKREVGNHSSRMRRQPPGVVRISFLAVAVSLVLSVAAGASGGSTSAGQSAGHDRSPGTPHSKAQGGPGATNPSVLVPRPRSQGLSVPGSHLAAKPVDILSGAHARGNSWSAATWIGADKS